MNGEVQNTKSRGLVVYNSGSHVPKARTPPRCQRHHSLAFKLTAPQIPNHFCAAASSNLVTWAFGPALCTTYNESSLTEAYQFTGPPRAPAYGCPLNCIRGGTNRFRTTGSRVAPRTPRSLSSGQRTPLCFLSPSSLPMASEDDEGRVRIIPTAAGINFSRQWPVTFLDLPVTLW
uniref:Uncharacterized protein n=1 Tax=Timema monikensis TaxID=170555 RepID=A0A7R9ED00_9NEOP|nr:unnamed protein product [Timema monikensis]